MFNIVRCFEHDDNQTVILVDHENILGVWTAFSEEVIDGDLRVRYKRLRTSVGTVGGADSADKEEFD